MVSGACRVYLGFQDEGFYWFRRSGISGVGLGGERSGRPALYG